MKRLVKQNFLGLIVGFNIGIWFPQFRSHPTIPTWGAWVLTIVPFVMLFAWWFLISRPLRHRSPR